MKGLENTNLRWQNSNLKMLHCTSALNILQCFFSHQRGQVKMPAAWTSQDDSGMYKSRQQRRGQVNKMTAWTSQDASGVDKSR
jgi:hypothetical protein